MLKSAMSTFISGLVFIQGLISPFAIAVSGSMLAVLWKTRLLHRNLLILAGNLGLQYFVGEIAGEFLILKGAAFADPGKNLKFLKYKLFNFFLSKCTFNENEKRILHLILQQPLLVKIGTKSAT